ncbi:unnamed protein product, partial [Ectocarpus sp. 13 AM-2016]
LRVRVDRGTPRTIWSPDHPQVGPDEHGSKIRVSSRVPILRALRLTWSLPMKDVLQIHSMEQWAWLEYLQVRSSAVPATL